MTNYLCLNARLQWLVQYLWGLLLQEAEVISAAPILLVLLRDRLRGSGGHDSPLQSHSRGLGLQPDFLPSWVLREENHFSRWQSSWLINTTCWCPVSMQSSMVTISFSHSVVHSFYWVAAYSSAFCPGLCLCQHVDFVGKIHSESFENKYLLHCSGWECCKSCLRFDKDHVPSI